MRRPEETDGVPLIPVLDMHSHFLINAFLFGKRFERRHGHAWLWNPLRNQYDLPRAREGGVVGATFTMYIPWWPTSWMDGVMSSRKLYEDVVGRCGSEIAECCTAADIRQAVAKNKFAAPLAIEGLHVIGKDLRNVDVLADMGVRMITLVHFVSTKIGDAIWGSEKHGGLSSLGMQAVRRMQELGIIVDLSHSSRKTFFSALSFAESPYVVSHSGVKDIGAGSRGMDDEQLRAIKDTDGVVGIIFFPWYLKKHTIFASIDLVADHIAAVAERIGVDHVGIGTDCDSNMWLPHDFKDVSYFPLLTKELLDRGFTTGEIGKIYMGNYMRVLERTDGRFTAD